MNKAVQNGKEEPPPSHHLKWKWRQWHERESPVKITGKINKYGVTIKVDSKQLTTQLSLEYPNGIWHHFPKDNKIKLLDNINYIFTSHLPFLLEGNIRLEYNTGYPHSFLWANQSFLRHLPSYWYLMNKKRGSSISPMLKTILNSRAIFARTKDILPSFPTTIDETIIIPFTFGKDSFLSYCIAKDIKLNPVLVWFNDPVDEGYEGKHKIALFEKLFKSVKDPIYCIDNPLGSLREKGEGWFGWELAITSWLLLSIPFAYKHKAGYIVVSNEKSTNSFFYDQNGYRVLPDYEQTSQATEEQSLLTQALTEGEVYTTTFLQGLHDIAIIAILKRRYRKLVFPLLMSCWSETKEGENKRWCGACTKCARIYGYLAANGVNPEKEAGFKDNLFSKDKEHLYNVFGNTASGTGWDAFGLNIDEQALAFYLTYLRGNKSHLIQKFSKTPLFTRVKTNFEQLLKEYYSLHEENTTPSDWKGKINRIFNHELTQERKDIRNIRKNCKYL